MKDNYIKILIAVLTLALGSALGHWTKSLQDKQANQMRYLDFDYQIRNDIIGHPDALGKKMNVFIDGAKVDNLSQIDIQLYNFTDKDFSDVPLVIEINSTTGDTLKFLNAQVAGQEGLPDFIQSNQEIGPNKLKGSLKFGYKLKTLNRIGNKPIFTASYLVVGKADHFQINTIQTNLDLVRYDYEHFKKPKLWENGYVILAFFLIIYSMIIIWVIRHSAKAQIKRTTDLGQFLKENLNVNGQDSSSISEQVIKLKNNFDRQRTQKWVRFIEGRKKPEK
jgi:hypothetical protein